MYKYNDICTSNICPENSGKPDCGLRDFIKEAEDGPRERIIGRYSDKKGWMDIDISELSEKTRLGKMVLAARERKEQEDDSRSPIGSRIKPERSRKIVRSVRRHNHKMEKNNGPPVR